MKNKVIEIAPDDIIEQLQAVAERCMGLGLLEDNKDYIFSFSIFKEPDIFGVGLAHLQERLEKEDMN